MMTLVPLQRIIIEPLVRAALREDLGLAGDLTTNAIVPPDAETQAHVVARKTGTIAGLNLAKLTFELIDPSLSFSAAASDGTKVEAGDTVATVKGKAAAILTGERVALNFLGHMGGIATLTASYVAAAAGHKAQIVCTRKTTPGLRAIEKYAVRAGGGHNHRFGLDDAVLIKDNHIAIAGGVVAALRRAKRNLGHLVKIEIEIDSLDQLREALTEGADALLLDNMSPAQLTEAVKIVAGRAVTEASGGVSYENVAAIAASGVDLISIGRLTHSAPALDIGLDFPG
jgi:nicotinate-nucleotide pyrophosphorylase (carboxylating)